MNTVVGLDIGTSYIRAAIGEVSDEGKVEIIGIAKNTIYSDKNKTREDIYNK